MKNKSTYTCCKCGVEYEGENKLRITESVKNQKHYATMFPYDICKPCVVKVKEFIGGKE